MTTSKSVYTAEAVASMSAAYTASPSTATVAEIAASLGVTVPSVRSKLASLGVYQKAEKPSGKRGKETKETLADALRELSGMPLPNIEAAGRDTLVSLIAHFKG